MKRLVLSIALLLGALGGAAHASPSQCPLPPGVVFTIHADCTAQAGSGTTCLMAREGNPFFAVRSVPIPTCTTYSGGDFVNGGINWTEEEAPFSSVLMHSGNNIIQFGVGNANGDDSRNDLGFKVDLRGPSFAQPLHLFEFHLWPGDHFTGSTNASVTLDQLDPQTAKSIRYFWSVLDPDVAKAVSEAKDAAAVAHQLDEYSNLANDLDDLLAKDFDQITDADLDALAWKYGDLPPDISNALKDVLHDLHKDIDVYRGEIASLVSTFQNQVAQVTDEIVTGAARNSGFDPANPTNYQPQGDPSTVPGVSAPQVGSDPFDPTHDPYAAYATQIIAKIDATIVMGAVGKRADFQEIVSSWRENQNVLTKALTLRSGTSQAEWGAFLQAQNRVLDDVRQYMDDQGWFKDSPVPESTRQLVDGLMVFHMAAQARALKNNLNLWVGPLPTPQQWILIDTLNGILDGGMRSLDNGAGDEDPDVWPAVEDMVQGSIVAAKQAANAAVSALPLAGNWISMCQVVTGREHCSPDSRELTRSEMVWAGAGIVIGSPIFWKFVGKAVVGVGSAAVGGIVQVIEHFSDISIKERKLLRSRLWSATVEVSDLTGKEAQLLLRMLQEDASVVKDTDVIVHDLAPALRGDGLKRLSNLEMFPVQQVAQDAIKAGGGRGVLALPSVRGKSLADIHELLKANNFKLLQPPPTGLEMWIHQDGSLVRIANTSGQRSYLMLKKEITNGPWKTAAADVLVKVTDDGVVAPQQLLGQDSNTLRAWFKNLVGKVPTALQQKRMEEAWAIMTHIPIGP